MENKYIHQVNETVGAFSLIRSLDKKVKEVLRKLGADPFEITNIELGDENCSHFHWFKDAITYSDKPLIYVEWDNDGYHENLHRMVFPIEWLYDLSYINTKKQEWEQSIREAKQKAELAELERQRQEEERKERELYFRLKEKYEGGTK